MSVNWERYELEDIRRELGELTPTDGYVDHVENGDNVGCCDCPVVMTIAQPHMEQLRDWLVRLETRISDKQINSQIPSHSA
jgi:hypothetical protein